MRKNNRRLNNINLTMIAIFIIFILFIIFIFSIIKKSHNKLRKQIINYGFVENANKDEINEICENSKIQKLIIEDAPYGHYDLKLELDDGRLISVNKEQFLNAKEGKKCKNISEN